MTTLLSEKEDSLRKLKETLRKTQQEGEESCQFTMFDVLLRYWYSLQQETHTACSCVKFSPAG